MGDVCGVCGGWIYHDGKWWQHWTPPPAPHWAQR